MVRVAVRALLVLAMAILVVPMLVAGPPAGSRSAPRDVPSTASLTVPADRPSIVLVLMDDFSMDLLPAMRHVRTMRGTGASYRHSYVADSLCCVSRASLFTGQYPHQTGVLTNTPNTPNGVGPIGGWRAFRRYGSAERAVNVALAESGYTTGLVGKYLNGYPERRGRLELPPGWSWWRAILGDAYDGWGFHSTRVRDGEVRTQWHAKPPDGAGIRRKDRAYVGSVIERKALGFVRRHRDDAAPYFLMVSTYATHSRVGGGGAYPGDSLFPPAFRDRRGSTSCGLVRCSSLGIGDLPGFGDSQSDNRPRRRDGTLARQWRAPVRPVPRAQAVANLRDRARMAQSVDRTLGRILDSVGEDTYVVLTSDNGFHIGQHGLHQAKGTPFVSDVRVPLLVTGPGVQRGVRSEVVSNIDLAATFEELAGLVPAPYRTGRSLVPTFADPGLIRRDLTFVEHTWAKSLDSDPDAFHAGGTMDRIPSYVAVRNRSGLLVRLDLDNSWRGERYVWEFYSYRRVGWERTNEYGAARHRDLVARLTRKLEQFDRCSRHTRGETVPEDCRRLTE